MIEDVCSAHGEVEPDLLLEAIWWHYQDDFRGYARSSLHKRTERARQRFGCPGLSQLQHRLLREPAVFAELMGFLVTQVSEMFREPAYFRYLRQKVVPHLRTWPSLKVWIAGCAKGLARHPSPRGRP